MRLPAAIIVAFGCLCAHAMPIGLRTAMWGAETGEIEAGTDIPPAAPSWALTLNTNGGKVDGGLGVDVPTLKISLAKGKAVGALPTPTRDGYAFKGWFTKKSGGTKITTKTKVTKNVTWYAQWTVKKYAVKVVKEGKGTVSGTGSKVYKSKVTLKAKAASGYVFAGWYEMGNGEWGTGNGEKPLSQKTTYSFKVPLNGVTYRAVFITKAADKAGIGMAFGGVGFGALEDDGGLAGRETLPVVTNTCGAVTTWPIAAIGLTPVSVSVKGHPKGMKYDAKKKAVTGVPSVANKSGTMTITVKSAGASRSWTVNWRTVALSAFARGTFNGWTYEGIGNGELGTGNGVVRKVTVSVTAAGKISAKVGTLSLAKTGWTIGEDGRYRVTLSATRNAGAGKKAKKYKDAMALVLDPDAEWTQDQLSGTFKTCFATTPDAPVNADQDFSARRNPFGDNADAKEVLVDIRGNAPKSLVDDGGTTWKFSVSDKGVATISRTTGTGKNRKTVSATAVVEVEHVVEGYSAKARFAVSGKVVEATW